MMAAALGAALLFGAAPRAHAGDDHAKCQHRVEKAEGRLDQAVRRYGQSSPQAQSRAAINSMKSASVAGARTTAGGTVRNASGTTIATGTATTKTATTTGTSTTTTIADLEARANLNPPWQGGTLNPKASAARRFRLDLAARSSPSASLFSTNFFPLIRAES